MRISIVICTWNRAELLAQTFASLRRCRTPSGIERTTVVVDNGSTDQTADVVGRLRWKPTVKLLVEPSPGLSNARNRAVEELMGTSCDSDHYVIWIDDDVAVHPGWLEAYVTAFREWPAAVVFGGPVIPELLGEPPDWLCDCLPEVAHVYGAIDLGDRPVPLGPGIDRLPYGCNFAVRADAFRGRRFDERLGRTHSGLGRGGEEIALMRSILADGESGRWVPDAGVRHRMDPERQTVEYLRAYSTADGLDAGLREAALRPAVPRLWARYLLAELRYRVRSVLSPPKTWVGDLLAAGQARGRLQAARRARRP